MGKISNIRQQPGTVSIGGQDRPAPFSFAGFGYLAERYGDMTQVFVRFNDRETMARFGKDDQDFLIDVIYASMLVLDDDGQPVEGTLSRSAIKNNLSLKNLKGIIESVAAALNSAMPDVESEGSPKNARKAG